MRFHWQELIRTSDRHPYTQNLREICLERSMKCSQDEKTCFHFIWCVFHLSLLQNFDNFHCNSLQLIYFQSCFNFMRWKNASELKEGCASSMIHGHEWSMCALFHRLQSYAVGEIGSLSWYRSDLHSQHFIDFGRWSKPN